MWVRVVGVGDGVSDLILAEVARTRQSMLMLCW